MMNYGLLGGFTIFFVLIYLALLGVSIYCIVLFIMFANRGIKAFDIYIRKNRDNNNYPDM